MSDYWTKYWQQGHLTSFGQDFTGNYTGSLKKVWSDFFEEMDENSTVLDIGTGNGALVDLALQSSKNLQIVGVDSAKLSLQDNLCNIDNVKFLEKTNAENLPFEDNKFDAVVSQFGIEYADLSKALPELARVLKPKGTFQLVMHDAKSSIVKPNTRILNAATALLESNGPLLHLRKLINTLSKDKARSIITENYRRDLNESIGNIAKTNEVGLHGTNFPSFLKFIMSPSCVQAKKKQNIALFEKELKGQIERLRDLCNAALTEQSYQLCIDLLKKENTSIIEESTLIENEMNVAKLLRGVKN